MHLFIYFINWPGYGLNLNSFNNLFILMHIIMNYSVTTVKLIIVWEEISEFGSHILLLLFRIFP